MCYIVTYAVYNHSTGELRSGALCKTTSLAKAQTAMTEDIEEWQESWGEDGEVNQSCVSASLRLSHLQIQYEIITF